MTGENFSYISFNNIMLKVFSVSFTEILINFIRPNKLKFSFGICFIKEFETTYKP